VPELTSFINSKPSVGGSQVILDGWHHRLDQSMFSMFLPEEWIGYDTENGNIVYAQLLHRINTKVSMEEDTEQSLNRKYLITTGNEPIVATALKFYKLMFESVPQLESHKLGNSKATGQVEHFLQESVRRPVQDAVTTAWSLPDDQK